ICWKTCHAFAASFRDRQCGALLSLAGEAGEPLLRRELLQQGAGGRAHARRRVAGGRRLEGLSRPGVAAHLLAEAAEGLRPYRRRRVTDGELDDRPQGHRGLAADDVEGALEQPGIGLALEDV